MISMKTPVNVIDVADADKTVASGRIVGISYTEPPRYDVAIADTIPPQLIIGLTPDRIAPVVDLRDEALS